MDTDTNEVSILLKALGLGAKAISWIRKIVAKRVIVTPTEIAVDTKHWDSNSSVIVQNVTPQPQFDVQIICSYEPEQVVEFKPLSMDEKPHEIGGGITVDSSSFIISGKTKDGSKNLHILTLSRLMPNESLEIGMHIKGRGKVRFLAASYSDKGGKQVLSGDKGIAIPFTPPYDMKPHGISLLMKRSPEK